LLILAQLQPRIAKVLLFWRKLLPQVCQNLIVSTHIFQEVLYGPLPCLHSAVGHVAGQIPALQPDFEESVIDQAADKKIDRWRHVVLLERRKQFFKVLPGVLGFARVVYIIVEVALTSNHPVYCECDLQTLERLLFLLAFGSSARLQEGGNLGNSLQILLTLVDRPFVGPGVETSAVELT